MAIRTTRYLRALALALTLAALTSQSRAADDPITLPDTPAAKIFAANLAAFNSGNRDLIAANAPLSNSSLSKDPAALKSFVDAQIAKFKENGPLIIRRINPSVATSFKVYTQGSLTGYYFDMGIALSPTDPTQITGTYVRAIETPMELLPSTKLTDKQIAQNTDALISALVKTDSFSGSILIAKDGQPIYQRTAGLANIEWNVPNTIDTKFNLASVGKMFTSVAIAQLVEQGKLHYDDTVGSILPDYPNKEVATKVRISHLLAHTSGIPVMPPDNAPAFSDQFRTLSQYLARFNTLPPAFEPGTKFLYSNCGYYLLGAIIEKASGQTYQDYVRDHIFKPAHMTNTDNYDITTTVPNFATGYMDAPGTIGTSDRRINMLQLPVVGVPCGLGYSTAPDMVKFADALQNNTLISADSFKTLAASRINNGRGAHQTYAFQLLTYNKTQVLNHGGGWVGITNQFDYYPDLHITVITLNNIDSNPIPLTRKIREWITQGTH